MSGAEDLPARVDRGSPRWLESVTFHGRLGPRNGGGLTSRRGGMSVQIA